jgi:hypothetical protein
MAHPKPPAPRITRTEPRHAGLPAERAFVVQLRADADLADGIVSGRVEHVVSGAAALFDSIEQLIACMHEAILRRSAPPGGDDPAS